MTKRYLICACCGGDAGRWAQWWNRDTGFGLCSRCAAWLRDRGESEETMRDLYGEPSVHRAA